MTASDALALELERLSSLAHRCGGIVTPSVMAEGAALTGPRVPAVRCGRVANDTFALWVSGDRTQGLATRLAGRLQRALRVSLGATVAQGDLFDRALDLEPLAQRWLAE